MLPSPVQHFTGTKASLPGFKCQMQCSTPHCLLTPLSLLHLCSLLLSLRHQPSQETGERPPKRKKKKHLDTIFYSFLLGLFALEESSVSTLCGEEEDTRKAEDEWARWT